MKPTGFDDLTIWKLEFAQTGRPKLALHKVVRKDFLWEPQLHLHSPIKYMSKSFDSGRAQARLNKPRQTHRIPPDIQDSSLESR